MRQRHVPERSCVACRTKRVKRDLVRIVRTPEGQVRVDPTGRANGRGAYLCTDLKCWDEGVSKGKLGVALKVTIPDATRRELIEYARLNLGSGMAQPAAPVREAKA